MSIQIFRSFIVPSSSAEDGTGLDASGVISRECYLAFLNAKLSIDDEKQARRFYRVLTTHLSAVDGRRPFKPSEEEAILTVLRKNEPWPCFANSPNNTLLGTGFRGRGYHEKLALEQEEKVQNRKRLRHLTNSTTTTTTTTTNSDVDTDNNSTAAHSPNITTTRTIAEVMEDNKFIRELTMQSVNFCRCFGQFGIDVWKSVLGVVRFAMLAKSCATSIPLNKIQALALCNEIAARRGMQEAVMVIDFTGGADMGRRVLAQNVHCTQYFGDMTSSEPPKHLCVAQEELYKVISTIATSFDQPGKEFSITQAVKNLAGTEKMYSATYVVDPQTYLLMVISRPL